MNLLQKLTGRPEARDSYVAPLSFADYLQLQYTVNGNTYPTYTYPTVGQKQEPIPNDFRGYVDGIYKRNGIVWACIAARVRLFSEARFQFQQLRGGRPGDLFGSPELEILERPWQNGTTGDLLARMEQDVSLAGNCYVVRQGRRLRRLRPDWVSIVLGSYDDPGVTADDLEAEIIGYVYKPNGDPKKLVLLLPEDVCHYAPTPDPTACYRGMSWLTPVVREIHSDNAATEHKLQFFNNAATPNLVVKLDKDITKEDFDEFVSRMDEQHQGLWNAYKTLYLGGGADVTVVGQNFQQMDFKIVQGAGETRIAAAAEVPPIIAGFSEGLSAATYSNYGQAKRKFGDSWARPMWRSAAGALETIVPPPAGSRLWYDDRDIPYLAEDKKDNAEIQSARALTIKALVDAGYKPDSVVTAVMSDDLKLLSGAHSGLFSVQLQPAGTEQPAPAAAPARSEMVVVPAPQVTVEGVTVHVPGQPAPHVDVHNEVSPTPVTVDVAAPNVTVEPARVVNVVEPTPVHVDVKPAVRRERTIRFEDDGRTAHLIDESDG